VAVAVAATLTVATIGITGIIGCCAMGIWASAHGIASPAINIAKAAAQRGSSELS
jgi:hypothetical protein